MAPELPNRYKLGAFIFRANGAFDDGYESTVILI
jgi:hypothetical protein